MKILKHKNIMGVIYGILLLMPFLAILARSAYVVVNKNAYQSYYGETINEEIKTQIDFNDIKSGNLININLNNFTTDMNGRIAISVQDNKILNLNTNTYYENVDTLNFYNQGGTTNYCYIIYNDSTPTTYINLNNLGINFQFYYNSYTGTTIPTIIQDNTYLITFNNYSYLDNVFDYSVSQFVEDNNFGRINMFSWFENMFLTDNQHNNLYIHFANWYMNYAMLISLMHIFFLVLMWFVNYVRRLLDRGLNDYDF